MGGLAARVTFWTVFWTVYLAWVVTFTSWSFRRLQRAKRRFREADAALDRLLNEVLNGEREADVRTTIEEWTAEPWLYNLGSHRKEPLLVVYGGTADPDALKRSWDLLLSYLDERQQADLLAEGKFTVQSSVGRDCEVYATFAHVNVYEQTEDGSRRYCTSPVVNIPLWDHILCQVMAIKHDWIYFRDRAANYGL